MSREGATTGELAGARDKPAQSRPPSPERFKDAETGLVPQPVSYEPCINRLPFIQLRFAPFIHYIRFMPASGYTGLIKRLRVRLAYNDRFGLMGGTGPPTPYAYRSVRIGGVAPFSLRDGKCRDLLRCFCV